MKIHAHFASTSSDCDGTYDRKWVVTPNDDERAGEGQDNWTGELDFHDRIVASVVNTYSILASGSLSVERNHDGSVLLEWDEGTEEGGISKIVVLCEDEDCDTEEPSTFRDHTAERAGY